MSGILRFCLMVDPEWLTITLLDSLKLFLGYFVHFPVRIFFDVKNVTFPR